jgi:hypothetical protein
LERKRKNNRRTADESNQSQSTICKPNFYSVASLLAFYSVASLLAATKVSIYKVAITEL